MSSNDSQPWTIQRLLAWTTDYFKKNSRESPRLAAEILLAEALHCQRIHLYTRFSEVPGSPQLAIFRDWVRRHAIGEPVAYLVGHREFYSLRFEVNRQVLIPRPETELLVLTAVDLMKNNDWSEKFFIDVGTGSGCIAITLLHLMPDWRAIATDLSPSALEVARRNAEKHGVIDRLDFLESDLLSRIPDQEIATLVVSNPPYIGRNEDGTVEPSVAHYEPDLALYGGETGIELTSRLIEESKTRLKRGGYLLLETSPFLGKQIGHLITQTGDFENFSLLKDVAGHDRLVVARRQSS